MSKQRGITLVEVLVAALVLGIGLLGIMGLQGRSLQYNQQAYLYSQATILAYDIADRMRVNRDSVGSYTIPFGDSGSGSKDCATENCSAVDLVNWDLRTWKADLASRLPLGDGEIKSAGGVGNQFFISVRFYPERDLDDPKEISATVEI